MLVSRIYSIILLIFYCLTLVLSLSFPGRFSDTLPPLFKPTSNLMILLQLFFPFLSLFYVVSLYFISSLSIPSLPFPVHPKPPFLLSTFVLSFFLLYYYFPIFFILYPSLRFTFFHFLIIAL